jgi:outer membrane cobalamin receptor
MEPWYTSDLSISRKWRMENLEWRIKFDVNNLLDQDYEVITNYPMPGRNFALTLSVEI